METLRAIGIAFLASSPLLIYAIYCHRRDIKRRNERIKKQRESGVTPFYHDDPMNN